MSNSLAPHPDPEIWIRLADHDLSPADAARLHSHLAGCSDCRQQFRLLEETVAGYEHFHDQVLKPSLPPPPEEWRPLLFPPTRANSPVPHNPARPVFGEVGQAVPPDWRVGRVPLATPFVLWGRPIRVPWLAAAAAALAAVILLVRLGHTPPVDAAELLRKAVVAEQAEQSVALSHRRIGIRTGRYSWIRPARLTNAPAGIEAGEAARIQRLFEAAGYSWDVPLSARVYSHWREGVSGRTDQVTVLSSSVKSYVVRTSTDAGPVSEASLTLRADDLHATACALRFRSNETIEVTELPAEEGASSAEQPPSPAPATPATGLRQNQPARATSADELHIMVALHGLGADLGEPIEVTRLAEQVRIRAAGLTPYRRQQLRAALADLPAANLELSEPPAMGRETLEPRRGVAVVEPVNPLIQELQALPGSDASDTGLADRLLDQTDRAIERAYALRSLARRFPGEVSEPWTPADHALLEGLARDHLDAMAASIAAIQQLLAPILPAVANPPAAQHLPGLPSDWRLVAETLPESLNQLDRLLNRPSGAGPDLDARKARLAQTLAAIRNQAAGHPQ